MAFCSSRLEPNIHTDHWRATLTFPYLRAISAESLTAAHSRELWLRGTFPDKRFDDRCQSLSHLSDLLPSLTCVQSDVHTTTHTLNYLGIVPLSASLTLRQSGPNKSSQERPGERKRVGGGANKRENRPKQAFSKHFTCSVTVTRKAVEHDLQTNHSIVKHFPKTSLLFIDCSLLFSSARLLSSVLTCNRTNCIVFCFYVILGKSKSTTLVQVKSKSLVKADHRSIINSVETNPR